MVFIKMPDEKSLTLLGGLIAIGLLTWNTSTTYDLSIDIASLKADLMGRVTRLETTTEKHLNRKEHQQ
jgi:hypothetical protein